MAKVPISIREFALPCPRVGSIEALSGFGRSTTEGQEIHLTIQDERKRSNPEYEAEVRIEHVFEKEGYRFEIGGRMDGLFPAAAPGGKPRIEEIKSSFQLGMLSEKLERETDSHPYCLQLRTYGYFYWLQNRIVPELSFCLVSSRNRERENLKIELDVEGYERWLELRLAELVEDAKRAEERANRRKKISENFAFPFSAPRSGQVELIQTVDGSFQEKKRLLVQAPTGLGKTVGVLYPSLKESLARGQKVVYVTPKNSQHAVAEDAVTRFQDTGAKLKSLTITAKSKICFKNEPLCNPTYCEYARDYYGKVAQNNLIDVLSKKKKLTAKTFKKMGEEYEVCPFELQLDAAADADVVVCDYNYVFAPTSAFGRMSMSGIGQEGKPNLVIDEAHNLPARAMDYYSPSLSTYVLENLRPSMRELPSRFAVEAELLLDECIQTIVHCKPDGPSRPTRIQPPAEKFLEQDTKLRAFLSRYLESDSEIQPRDVVLRFSFYWSEFTEALHFVSGNTHPEFFTTFQPHPSGGIIKITCCDASEMLKACYDEYDQVVGFSATLRPFAYYAELSGLDPDEIKTAEFQSPFPKSNRKLLIIPQISTKYSDRERNYGKIAEAISRIAVIRPGNYFVFFPSFDFLEKVLGRIDLPPGFTAIRQERDMRAADVEAVIEHLRAREQPTLVFAVQGGVFSEGVDYPGETIIGAFVVGPPLPSFDLERETMREYYEKTYGKGAGFDYAYSFPAMAKAVQAAGRVIRSETDRGLIVLMDGRFVQSSYTQSMPTDWFKAGAYELVSASILKEVTEFWGAESADSVGCSSPLAPNG